MSLLPPAADSAPMQNREHSPEPEGVAERDRPSDRQSRHCLEECRARRNYCGQVERFGELGADAISDVLRRDLIRANLACDRSHDDSIDAAGNYQIEERKIVSDVEVKAVPRISYERVTDE